MKTEVIIALIASCTSVLVAVVTLIVSVMSTRHSARSMKEVERLKFELAQAAADRAAGDRRVDESLAVLQIAIQSIQELKDEVQLALSAKETGGDFQSSLERIKAARERIFTYYERHLAVLDEGEAKLFHDAKNISLAIVGCVGMLREFSKSDDPNEAVGALTKMLAERRGRLSDIQQRLRDRRSEVMMKKLGVAQPAEPPLVGAPASLPPAREGDASDDSVPSLEGVKVIVVEDDEDPRELLKLVLIRSGAEVSACSDPAEAMERFVKWTPDILISDIGLPGEDGYGLIRRVRGLTPERGGQIPAIALTAYSGESDKARILSAGFQMHITKPLDPKELVRAVSKLTGGAA